jgi:hypothetical protein
MNRFTTQLADKKLRFRVGSSYFFDRYADFKAGDVDYVEFEEQPKLYKNVLQFRKADKTMCLFKWRKMSADEFVQYTLRSKLPMELGKFLVPEVAEYLGITIDHLKQLRPVADRLDAKHQYEKTIYNAYIHNNAFTLTEEQRRKAYIEYRQERGI